MFVFSLIWKYLYSSYVMWNSFCVFIYRRTWNLYTIIHWILQCHTCVTDRSVATTVSHQPVFSDPIIQKSIKKNVTWSYPELQPNSLMATNSEPGLEYFTWLASVVLRCGLWHQCTCWVSVSRHPLAEVHVSRDKTDTLLFSLRTSLNTGDVTGLVLARLAAYCTLSFSRSGWPSNCRCCKLWNIPAHFRNMPWTAECKMWEIAPKFVQICAAHAECDVVSNWRVFVNKVLDSNHPLDWNCGAQSRVM